MPASRQPPKLPGSAASVWVPSQAGFPKLSGSWQQAAPSRQPWEWAQGHHQAFPDHADWGTSWCFSILSPSISPGVVQVNACLVSPAFIAPHSAKTGLAARWEQGPALGCGLPPH